MKLPRNRGSTGVPVTQTLHMRTMNQAGKQQSQRGTSTLEFVAVLPTLLFIFFAIMELSRAWLTVNVVTTASREGARMGSVTFPFDPALAEGRINEILASANLSTNEGAGVTCEGIPDPPVVTACTTTCATGCTVNADVQVTFDTVLPFFLPMLLDIDINRTTTMRYE
jgi:Flp pilus assembly protein TadG